MGTQYKHLPREKPLVAAMASTVGVHVWRLAGRGSNLRIEGYAGILKYVYFADADGLSE